jgi:hypothetical protein
MTGWHWLFGGEVYYPSGGMNDLLGMYPTLDAAKAMRRRYRFRLRVVGGRVSVLKAPLGVRRIVHREEQYMRVVHVIRNLGVDCVGNVYDVELRDVRRVQRNFKHSLRFRAKQISDNTFQIRRTR